ncbi:unnamed protein product [Polarella glacialis]|uniref:Uncharacterized protein n=1 Tax=Polarella glacialis TaxID=89957 RepID=A0A813LIQ2_POLGL|nr:unnamed protein product [Polarella glacialis]
MAEEAKVEEATLLLARHKLAEQQIERSMQEASDGWGMDNVFSCLEWAEERQLCPEKCEEARVACRVMVETDLRAALEDRSWCHFASACENGKRLEATEVLSQALLDWKPVVEEQLANMLFLGSSPDDVVKWCRRVRDVSMGHLLEVGLWEEAQQEALSRWDSEIDCGIRDEDPRRLLWACKSKTGADAAEVLRAKELATKLLRADLANAEQSGQVCQISRAYQEARDARILVPREDTRLSNLLSHLRSHASLMEVAASGNMSAIIEAWSLAKPEQQRVWPKQIEAVDDMRKCVLLAQLVVKVAIFRSEGSKLCTSECVQEPPLLGDAEVKGTAGQPEVQLTPSETLLQALDVGPLHARSARLLVNSLAQDICLETFATTLEFKVRFSPQLSRGYSLENADYGLRGHHQYYKPLGWLRWSLRMDNFQTYRDWPVAYHGTSLTRLLPILLQGLQPPGAEGVEIAHGQAYSLTGSSIYFSPSIEYAAFPVYAQFFLLADKRWAQIVLQCRVRPGSYQSAPGTLGGKYWPPGLRFDPNFTNLDHLEWLVEDPANIVVCGIMLREFGPKADALLFGSLACSVTAGSDGPEFEWTKLRKDEFRRAGQMLLS